MRLWSDLPGELLETIEWSLTSYTDKVRVRAVCISWNSHLPKVRISCPRLLQAFENKSNPTHGLFDIILKKFDLLDLPELQQKVFKGSSYGWVVTSDDSPGKTSPDIFVINPLTRVKIELPQRYMFPDVKEYNVDNVDNEYTLICRSGSHPFHSNYVHLDLLDKVVLSSSPLREDCVVVAIYGTVKSLAWCRCNDNNWKTLYENLGQHENFRPPITDVLFHRGKLYALNHYQLLVFENIGSPDPKVTNILLPIFYQFPSYLVENSDGELLMVERYVDIGAGAGGGEEIMLVTKAFKVYKLDLISSSWVEVKNIGDNVLFLGFNSSVAISSRKFPVGEGNRIYFTGSPMGINLKGAKGLDSDIGVFNIEDGSFEPLPGFKRVPRSLWPPPIWVYDSYN